MEAQQGPFAGFDKAAARYDLMVAMNAGYRRHLRAAAEQVLTTVDPTDLGGAQPVLLDLGCGSGLSTRELLKAARRRGLAPRIIGVDASPGMLERARAKDWPAGVEFVHGFGERLGELELPAADGALACYLLRNVPDLPATLSGIHAALKPGAQLVAEDFSVRDDPCAARRWRMVNRAIIEPLARVVGGEVALYRYLHSSVDEFIGIEQLADGFERAGFGDVRSRTVDGWQCGILHLVRGTA